MSKTSSIKPSNAISFERFRKEVLDDYRIALESREASLTGRKEVLTGKAKFGIFGDGKEVAQLAMAKQFRNGDFRSGYYRDQTFMMAAGLLTVEQFFAQLYAHTDPDADPSSAGRQMNAHLATRLLNDDGSWKELAKLKNSSADLSPIAAQMPRLLGLAYASKFYRHNSALSHLKKFSDKGNEVAFGTIGDAGTSEGMFFETFNAAGVLQVPLTISIWDDNYGISVPKSYQTTKEDISEILKGFQRDEKGDGFEIFKVKGWDYPALCETYQKAVAISRQKHIPALIHVDEMTQPQGHSTSGSHERYKSQERLNWEEEFDPIRKMRSWIIDSAIADDTELQILEAEAKKRVAEAQKSAWNSYLQPIQKELSKVTTLLDEIIAQNTDAGKLMEIKNELAAIQYPFRKDIISAAKKSMRIIRKKNIASRSRLARWLSLAEAANTEKYNSFLYSGSSESALKIAQVKPVYEAGAALTDGRIVLRDNFDAILAKYPEALIFGEDSGKIGGVNQGLEGLQKKYGELRVFDTGIRETTIVGQAIGMAMRGLRPIAEIQYLDYLLYAIQIISDDLATLQYRTRGGQKAPVIIRTRGHRLEGIWHSGSPMGMIINAVRGIYVCVPRNMTQAAGFYNTLLASDEPGLVVESLNGYRLKEKIPSNPGEYRVPLGVSETIIQGTDITLVTYGSLVRMAAEAAKQLAEADIFIEVVDVQTLIPFDIHHSIVESLKKTNRIIFLDEDVPGGASAYMMQKTLEEQGGYYYLDSPPVTLSARENRPAYGTDGDYFTKPNIENIFDKVYQIMHDADPLKYPSLY